MKEILIFSGSTTGFCLVADHLYRPKWTALVLAQVNSETYALLIWSSPDLYRSCPMKSTPVTVNGLVNFLRSGCNTVVGGAFRTLIRYLQCMQLCLTLDQRSQLRDPVFLSVAHCRYYSAMQRLHIQVWCVLELFHSISLVWLHPWEAPSWFPCQRSFEKFVLILPLPPISPV